MLVNLKEILKIAEEEEEDFSGTFEIDVEFKKGYANVVATNNTSEIQDAVIIMTSYDENDNLRKMSSVEYTEKPNSSRGASFSLDTKAARIEYAIYEDLGKNKLFSSISFSKTTITISAICASSVRNSSRFLFVRS